MKLFVAEKPSVARDLARVLGANTRRDGWLEGNGVRVAWCLGHLVEPAPPDAHDARWKRWDPALLPMLPPQLKLQPIKKTRAHFTGLKRLLNARDVDVVVNACDAGREGELIFRYVYVLAGCTKPTQRFWVSSMTPAALRAGLQRLRDGADFDALGAAARCRAEADWLVGMNATRGLTALGDSLLSVGRVQTPTLAMLVEREDAIESFVPEPYWEVEADLTAPKGDWKAQWIGPADQPPPKADDPQRGRLSDAATAEALAARLRGAEGVVTAAERTTQQVQPPPLHHLTSLQREANKRFGLTADQTLKAAQTLYEKHKLITYPRTDSRHLTRDVAATLPAVVAAVETGPWAPHARRALDAGPPALGKRYVDDAQVGDHHAILPTDLRPDASKLTGDVGKVYDLIVRRLLAALHPPAVYAKTRLEVEAAGQRLEAKGRVCLDPGWEAVEPPARRDDDAPALPPVEPGDPARVRDARSLAKETRPPPRFTDATLLGAMERAGKSLDDAALRAAMRDCGLGTPATRAATLETLIRRGYVGRQGKALTAEPPGRALIGALPVDALKSPTLTAQWERRLQAIAEGADPPMAFRRDIRRFVADAVAALRAAPRLQVPTATPPTRGGRRRSGGERTKTPRVRVARSAPDGPPRCPLCHEGTIVKGNRGWGCARWREGCGFVVWFERDGVRIPEDEAERLFRQGTTRPFAVPPGQTEQARLVLDLTAEGRVRWATGAARAKGKAPARRGRRRPTAKKR